MSRIESPSSINLYRQCPRRYYYAYIEKLPGKENIYTLRGGIVHKTLQQFFQMNTVLLTDENYDIVLKVVLMNLFNSYWKESQPKILELLEHNPLIMNHYYYETMAMIDNWLRAFLEKFKLQLPGKNVQEAFLAVTPETEQKFVSDFYQVQGYIDAIHDDEEGVVLLDYKTSRKDVISEEYKLQLGVYALLYRENRKVLPKKVGIQFLSDGKIIFLETDESLILRAEYACKEMQECTKSHEKQDYPKKPGKLCKYSGGQCDFYEVCRPFDAEEDAAQHFSEGSLEKQPSDVVGGGE